MKKFFAMFSLSAIIIGHGLINPSHTFPAAKIYARTAAIVDVQRQTGGKHFEILKESFDGKIFTIEAEVK